MEFFISVNKNKIKAAKGETILNVLRQNGINVPTLCNMENLTPTGACRLCVVELENENRLVTACSTPVKDGMIIHTHSRKVIAARKTIVELLLTNHPENCLYCDKSGNCELQELAENLNIRERSFVGEKLNAKTDRSSPGIIRDMSKCILCGRCVRICEETLEISAIDLVNRGKYINIETVFQRGLFYSNCIHCGLCITACPTGAILEKTYIPQLTEKLNDSEKQSEIIIANASIADIAVNFNIRKFEDARGFLVAALRDIGFDKIYTLGPGNEIFINENVNIISANLSENANPVFVTDCPAVKKYIKTELPDLFKYVSKIPVPQQILAKIIKPDEEISKLIVSVSSCVAHKYEAVQSENTDKGVPEIDYVITTRELVRLLKTHGVSLPYTKKETPDKPSNSDTSASALFETKGGIAETILRELFFKHNAQKYPKKIFEVKSDKAFVEYEFELDGKNYKIASVHGVDTLRIKKDELLAGNYLFVEIRSCSFGCISGCGHLHTDDAESAKKNRKIILEYDEKNSNDTVGKNPFIKGYYKEKGKDRLF